VRIVRDAAGALAAATGLVMSTYTGVLVGATAIPVWAKNAKLLPIHFGASALGSAVGALDLFGREGRALNLLAIGAAAAESFIGLSIELDRGRSQAPLRTGQSGWLVRAGGTLSGPVVLALRLLAGRSSSARRVASFSALLGSLLTRIGWVAAGRASARDPLPALETAEDVGSRP
jgi:hypothetical protein